MKAPRHKIILFSVCSFLMIFLAVACTKKTEDASAVISITPAVSEVTAVPDNTPEVVTTTPVLTVAPETVTATPALTVAPETVTATPALTATPAPKTSNETSEPTKAPKPTPLPTEAPSVSDSDSSEDDVKIIAIDAGHQSKGNYEKEPIGPGADVTKPKVSSGTQGAYTGVPEYKLTLQIARKVEQELLDRGYKVIMIRETNDVDISNKERAEIANESGAELFIRIHADGSENKEVHGVSTLYPSKKNPYVPQLYKDSYRLSKLMVDSICNNTGAKNRGAIARDDMSGINWCTIPVTIIEMGYMTNKSEDTLMQTTDYQDKIVQGICDGIDQYFEELQ